MTDKALAARLRELEQDFYRQWSPHRAETCGRAADLIEKMAEAKPVAMRHCFDGHGWLYIDGGSGSDWLTRHADGEPLYAAPQPAPTPPAQPADELPPLPKPIGYVTENGLKQLQQDDATIFLYPHPYLIRPNETRVFAESQTLDYARAALAQYGIKEQSDETHDDGA